MTVLLDTNVLFAALSPGHQFHVRSRAWLAEVQAGRHAGVVSAHSLCELFANLTRVPVRPDPIRTPAEAGDLIRREVLPHFTSIPLDAAEYVGVMNDAAASGLQGGMIYDAIIAAAARKAGADRPVTANLKHFPRV